jgi:murein DD-endopeptidase MepM/ murein hydrolase activator NlpD
MRCLLTIILLLFFSSTVHSELFLVTPKVHNGDVVVVRWQGEPLSFGVVRFMDRVIYLYPDAEGDIALLPVGLDVKPGVYNLSAALASRQGETTARELQVEVAAKERPVEHLSLPERMVTPGKKDLSRIARENKLLGEVFSQISNRAWTSFELPVNDPVSSVFGKRRLMNGKPRSPHSGTDFRSPKGTPVHSISNGRIVLVEDLFYTGKTVVVDHGEGLYSLYAHLSKVMVAEGDELLGGDVLGAVGSTGRSTGAHLHLTVKLLEERVDPESLLKVFKE